MKNYKCPRCNGGEFVKSTPCPACDGTGNIPETIINSLKRYGRQHEVVLEELIGILKNGMDHFYFWRNGVYHGVEYKGENRGYIHT